MDGFPGSVDILLCLLGNLLELQLPLLVAVQLRLPQLHRFLQVLNPLIPVLLLGLDGI